MPLFFTILDDLRHTSASETNKLLPTITNTVVVNVFYLNKIGTLMVFDYVFYLTKLGTLVIFDIEKTYFYCKLCINAFYSLCKQVESFFDRAHIFLTSKPSKQCEIFQLLKKNL